jgi:hypothetical protein
LKNPIKSSISTWGHVAEWLRNGLQNRVHQFNSGRGLHSIPLISQNYLILGLFQRARLQPDLLPLLFQSLLDGRF